MAGKKIGEEQARRKRLLIVDDHPLMRLGLTMALTKGSNYEVCGEAADHHEAMEKIKALKPDLVTMDLSLRNSHGLELIKDIRAQFPALLVLVVSVQDELLNARRVVSAGAQGFLSKLEPLTQVVTAVERIFAGEIYVSHQVTSQIALKMVGRHHLDNTPSIHNLTDRELQVFELMGEGLGVRQIGSYLNLGISTIETYRARIKEKFGIKSLPELRQLAIRWNRNGSLTGNAAEHQTQTSPGRAALDDRVYL